MSKPIINCRKCKNFLDIEEAKKRKDELKLLRKFPFLTRYSRRDIVGICLAEEIPYIAIPFRLECKSYKRAFA